MTEHHNLFMIFGATGDLAHRKLLPALYYLEQENHLHKNFKIICIARKDKTHEQYRKEAEESIRKFSRIKVKDEFLKLILPKVYYQKLDINNPGDYKNLREFAENISGKVCHTCERIFYLAVPSSLFGTIVDNLHSAGLAKKDDSIDMYNRIMFEKPFGYDLASAKKLNNDIAKVFTEKQIYRIDHYMAKELVQNLLVLRFANSIFEPLWNKEYIDHIQLTASETLGVEGRANYYEQSGAIRDIMQNHMMQLLCLVGMEAPKSMEADDVKDKKVKVLRSIHEMGIDNVKDISVTGQYGEGIVNEEIVPAYRDESGVEKLSKTETFFALKLEINNKMWKGVPFYLRTGKRLKEKSTEIAIVYHKVPFHLFANKNPEKNMMIIRVQPHEGITIHLNAKVPGNKVVIDSVNMDFCHECKFGQNSPEAYEKLLYDVIVGDQTLFTRWDEVENSWKLFDTILNAYKGEEPFKYESGSWGPKAADDLIKKDGREWVHPQKPAYAEISDKK